MATVQPTQAFYSLSIVPSSATADAVVCNVMPGISNREQQFFEARGSRLYLRRVIENEEHTIGHLGTVLEQDTFSIVRHVAKLRISSDAKLDHLVIVTDAGTIALLEYDGEENVLKQLHLETFGKSGIRRTIPGQYMAADPLGRCIMLASTEKNKLVYMFQRLPDGTINVSSPHEANTWATLTYDLCAVHVGWSNPVFAALEVDYSESEQDETGTAYQNREKMLSYYTVDLGLNHVVRTWTEMVDYTANKIFGVPGGMDGPSGVIVCAKGRIYYKHEDFPTLSIAIPRRAGPLEDPTRDRIIVAGHLFIYKAAKNFFHLLQTDDGDVFMLRIEYAGEDSFEPERLVLRYYETLPLASSIVINRKGYIVVAAEHGATKLYHIEDLADDPIEESDEPHNVHTSEGVSSDPSDTITPTTFQHRGLKYISDMSTLSALHPLIRTRVENILDEDAPQILALQGTGNNSSFKMIKHGNSVIEDASIVPGGLSYDCVWSLPESREEDLTKYIVLSSKHAEKTMILGVNGDDVVSTDETAFMQNRSTILAALMGSDTMIQVHARGVLSMLANGTTNEWPTPAHCTISCAAANERQLLVGLSSGELSFFFMSQDGVLSALEDQPEMTGTITAMGLANTPVGKLQAKFGVVGCDDHTIRVLSITLDAPLETRSIQAVSAPAVSIVVTEMPDPDSGTDVTVVHLGLQSGVYLRAVIDEVTGDLSQTRSRFLGTKPVRIFPVELQGQQCVILCSSQPWIGYHHPVTREYTVTPLATPWLDAVTQFISARTIGVCGCANVDLRFFYPDKLGQRFVQEEIKLQYTPRNMAKHPSEPLVYVIEADANTMSMATQEQLALNPASEVKEYAADAVLGNPKAPGHWASCIQILDPVIEKKVLETVHLDDNEAALCCAVVSFESKDWEPYLMVGTGRDMNVAGTSQGADRGGGFVRAYKLHDEGRRLELFHKTEFPQPIYALIQFKGRMAMGIGAEVFIYDLGNKHILRKTRGTGVPNAIVSLNTLGNRIICGDVSESVTFVVFNEEFNRLVPFVDDTVARWTTSAGMIDYDTVAGGDKFGNLWVMRCPEQISRESDDQGLNGYIMNERPYMGGTPYRLENRAHFFCQDIPMSVQRTPLVPGGQDILFWSGLQGTLGMLVPFISRTDVTFFTQLELQMRLQDPSLAGRDHLSYRSYYSPVRAVIDGDLCERFMQLHYDKKQKIAAEVDREIIDVEKKIQEMRTRVSY